MTTCEPQSGIAQWNQKRRHRNAAPGTGSTFWQVWFDYYQYRQIGPVVGWQLRYANISQRGGGDPDINDFRLIVNYDFPRP